jgi:hypothetical protein
MLCLHYGLNPEVQIRLFCTATNSNLVLAWEYVANSRVESGKRGVEACDARLSMCTFDQLGEHDLETQMNFVHQKFIGGAVRRRLSAPRPLPEGWFPNAQERIAEWGFGPWVSVLSLPSAIV